MLLTHWADKNKKGELFIETMYIAQAPD